MQKAKSFNDAVVAYVKGNACRIQFWYMSKDDTISIMNNSNLIDKKGVLLFFFLTYKIWVNAIPLRKLIMKETKTWY